MKWTLKEYRSRKLLAKSETYNPITLQEHLSHVASSVILLAKNFEIKASLAQEGAYLHDIGKAHPIYQAFVHGFKEGDARLQKIPHRHEISSLAFLPLFDKDKWPFLTEMVVAHHKSTKHDKRSRGLIDIVNREGLEGLFESHLKDWEVWSPRALKILKNLGVDTTEISLREAQQALKWCLNYVENLGDGWSKWKGLLMSADHMASALGEDLSPFLKRMFQPPTFVKWHEPNDLYPLSQKDTNNTKSHTLVLAPTGAGKTDFLLKRCRNRIFYVLPFQASINAMYKRIQNMTSDDTDVRFLHAASKLVADDQSKQEVQLQPFVGANIKILTPHQISNIVFGTMGFESTLLDLKECDVILDEIHTYRAENQAMVIELVKILMKQNCRIHIGTATMPSSLYKTLLKILGGKDHVYEVELTNSELKTYDRHTIYKHTNFQELETIIYEAMQNQEKLLVVCNTVRDSQEIYSELHEKYPDIPSMLIHSRFRRMDRKEREEKLQSTFNSNDGPCIVVSTQVVEVSLDLSFDRMITQAAPIDSLIQRFGRINRYRLPNQKSKLKSIHLLAPSESTLPYKKEVVKKSFDMLPNEDTLHTTAIQSLIDKVYPNINVQEISGYVKWKDNGIAMEKLRHISEPILMKYLDINSTTCILEKDHDKYKSSSWKERQWLEIPVNERSLYPVKEGLLKAQNGSEPYILPEQNEYEQLGLVIKKPNNFI
ncbi:MAG: CRISPR-associated helicase Cas3' [Patescibacteria group bacterium]|nr:CRISPR-associated helicase Cas3' [Patescibacteria group bacterium]